MEIALVIMVNIIWRPFCKVSSLILLFMNYLVSTESRKTFSDGINMQHFTQFNANLHQLGI